MGFVGLGKIGSGMVANLAKARDRRDVNAVKTLCRVPLFVFSAAVEGIGPRMHPKLYVSFLEILWRAYFSAPFFFGALFFWAPFCFSAGKKERSAATRTWREQDPKPQKECWVATP